MLGTKSGRGLGGNHFEMAQLESIICKGSQMPLFVKTIPWVEVSTADKIQPQLIAYNQQCKCMQLTATQIS